MLTVGLSPLPEMQIAISGHEPTRDLRIMKYRIIGQTDLNVSTVAMGCWAVIGGFNWGPQDEADSLATFEAALNADSAAAPVATDIRYQPGRGVEGNARGARWRFGSRALHTSVDASVPSALDHPHASGGCVSPAGCSAPSSFGSPADCAAAGSSPWSGPDGFDIPAAVLP